jgi:DNA repair protein RadC
LHHCEKINPTNIRKKNGKIYRNSHFPKDVSFEYYKIWTAGMKENQSKTVYSANEETKHIAIRDWREDEKPREKLMHYGASSLNESELLAIIISSGTVGVSAVDLARDLLNKHQTISKLSSCDISEYQQVKGIGPAKAITLSAVFEIGRRIRSTGAKELAVMSSPEDIASIFIPRMKDARTESFIVLLMNSSNQIFRDVTISTGSLDTSLVHPREVFRLAITENCSKIVLLHNHPSGNLKASQEDIRITNELVEAGKLIGIEVLDHLIIAGNQFSSFKQKGIL